MMLITPFQVVSPTPLKQVDITSTFKKDNKVGKEYCSSVSILLVWSKVYVKLMYEKLYQNSKKLFSKLQCDFWKGLTQNTLLLMIEKWRKSLDQHGHTGALLTDFLKNSHLIVQIMRCLQLNKMSMVYIMPLDY